MHRKLPLLLSAMMVITIIVFSACYKQVGELIITYPNDLRVQQNVYVIDSTELYLLSDEAEIKKGIYRFSVNGDAPAFGKGDIIVGEQGLGFLRKVKKRTDSGSELVVNTAPATLEHLFYSGNFNLALNLAGSQRYKTLDLGYELSDHVLYNKKGALLVANGHLEFESDLHLNFSFTESRIDSFLFKIRNAAVNTELQLTAEARKAISIVEATSTLTGFKKRSVVYLSAGRLQIPVVVEVTTDFEVSYSANLGEETSTDFTFVNDNRLQMDVMYETGQWSATYEHTPAYALDAVALEEGTEALIDLELRPVVTVKIYGVAGPEFSVGLNERLEGQVAASSPDWNFSAATWATFSAGVDTQLFGPDVSDFSQSDESEPMMYRTPFELQKIAGDQQVGRPQFPLINPIQVQVLDELGRPQPGVPVYADVKSGGGRINRERTLTNAEGVADIYWILGPTETTDHSLEVTVKTPDGGTLAAAPLVFTATSDKAGPFSFTGSWLMISHSNINCLDEVAGFVRHANIEGIICAANCTSNIVCFEGCARTSFEFDESNVVMYNELFNNKGKLVRTDSTFYKYALFEQNSFVLSNQDNSDEVFVVDFTLNGNEVDLITRDLTIIGDCEEEILLLRQ